MRGVRCRRAIAGGVRHGHGPVCRRIQRHREFHRTPFRRRGSRYRQRRQSRRAGYLGGGRSVAGRAGPRGDHPHRVGGAVCKPGDGMAGRRSGRYGRFPAVGDRSRKRLRAGLPLNLVTGRASNGGPLDRQLTGAWRDLHASNLGRRALVVDDGHLRTAPTAGAIGSVALNHGSHRGEIGRQELDPKRLLPFRVAVIDQQQVNRPGCHQSAVRCGEVGRLEGHATAAGDVVAYDDRGVVVAARQDGQGECIR